MSWVSLCSFSELTDGQGKSVDIDGFSLAVFRSGESVHVMDSACPHAGANLSGGFVEDGCAVCPWHFWAFDLSSGQLRDSPGVAIRTYPVRLRDHTDGPLVQANLPIV